jgi:hypothetical protein
VIVIQDCNPSFRRIFKIWEEGRAPQALFEVTSKATRREDLRVKPDVYAQIGVSEYFLYDPTAEYLRPPLQGYRLQSGKYVSIEANDRGQLLCEQLGITLELSGSALVLRDAKSGEKLPTSVEAAEAKRKESEAKHKKSEAKRKESEAKRKESEAKRKESEAKLKQAEADRHAMELRNAELEQQIRRLQADLDLANDQP